MWDVGKYVPYGPISTNNLGIVGINYCFRITFSDESMKKLNRVAKTTRKAIQTLTLLQTLLSLLGSNDRASRSPRSDDQREISEVPTKRSRSDSGEFQLRSVHQTLTMYGRGAL